MHLLLNIFLAIPQCAHISNHKGTQSYLSIYKTMCGSPVWCVTPIVPALRTWRQMDSEFKTSLDYITPCL